MLVTGAAGFTGAHLVARLEALGHEVIAQSRQYSNRQDGAAITSCSAELADREQVMAIFEKYRPEAVAHLAARIPRCAGEFLHDFFDDNVRATGNICHCAATTGVERIVLSSTMSVYGTDVSLPVDERHPTHPSTPYAASKIQAELCCELYAHTHGLRSIVLRYSGIYGPGMKSGAVPTFLQRCRQGAPMVLHSQGRPSSDYVWVDDVVSANILALEKIDGPVFDVFNIGSGIELPVAKLATIIRSITGSSSEIELSKESSPRDMRFVFNIEKARSELGYRPHSPEGALAICLPEM